MFSTPVTLRMTSAPDTTHCLWYLEAFDGAGETLDNTTESFLKDKQMDHASLIVYHSSIKQKLQVTFRIPQKAGAYLLGARLFTAAPM